MSKPMSVEDLEGLILAHADQFMDAARSGLDDDNEKEEKLRKQIVAAYRALWEQLDDAQKQLAVLSRSDQLKVTAIKRILDEHDKFEAECDLSTFPTCLTESPATRISRSVAS